MSRKPDTPCTVCGEMTWSGRGSRPAHLRICLPCRRSRRSTCAFCGESFRAAQQRQECCSASCGQLLRADRAGCNRRRSCEICAEPYTYTYPNQRTCGRPCGWELRKREGKVPVRVPRIRGVQTEIAIRLTGCVECGQQMLTATSERLCSLKCRRARRYRAERGKRRVYIARACICGAVLDRGRKFCDQCRDLRRVAAKQRERRRRRALEHKARSEPYALVEIAERDRKICALCHGPVDMSLAVPHRQAPTVDHIVPLSEGGDDTPANVQLAHFTCNSSKGARGSQQLALVG